MTTLQLIALGLATAIRPTSLAAVGALAATTTPRRFLTAYVLAGLAFTISVGAAAIWLLQGVDISTRSGPLRASAEIVIGLVAITFGLLLLTGRITGHQPEAEDRNSPSRWTTALSKHVSVRRAALAGPVTHLPGLLYLIAINLIVTEQQSTELSVVDLLIYNGLWFALPLTAWALSIIRPEFASRAIAAVQPWVRKRGKSLLAVVCLTLGGALAVHGLMIW